MFDLEVVSQFIIVFSFKVAGIGPPRMRLLKGKLFKQYVKHAKVRSKAHLDMNSQRVQEVPSSTMFNKAPILELWVYSC